MRRLILAGLIAAVTTTGCSKQSSNDIRDDAKVREFAECAAKMDLLASIDPSPANQMRYVDQTQALKRMAEEAEKALPKINGSETRTTRIVRETKAALDAQQANPPPGFAEKLISEGQYCAQLAG